MLKRRDTLWSQYTTDDVLYFECSDTLTCQEERENSRAWESQYPPIPRPRITHTPQETREENIHKVQYCMLQGNHGGKEVVPGSSHWFGFPHSQPRDEPKKGTQHELSLAENFSKPIGLKQFHHGIPEHEKAQLSINIVKWGVRVRHLFLGEI